MPFVFCDLNFIITAHQEPDAYKQHLRQLAGAGTVTFVLSPMHWVEAAEDANPVRGTAKADFMDSLLARWIYDRRSVQRREATAAFLRFLKIQAEPQMIGSIVDVIADLSGVRAERNSRDFVVHLRGIGQNHPLEQSLQQAFDSNRVNGDRFRAGKLDQNFLRNIEKLYIQGLLPAQTPAGVVIDGASKRRFLDGSQLTDFPAFAVESLATYDSWRENRQMNRNNFMDQQHLMALPYVNFFLTDDARLRALIGRISPGLPFTIATLLTKAEFDLLYPMNLLREFAAKWSSLGLKVEGERIRGCYGFLVEYDSRLWMWTHSHSPNRHEFFPILNGYDEMKAVWLLTGQTSTS